MTAQKSTEWSPHWASGLISTVISVLVVVLAIFGGFWSLADPRADIKDIRAEMARARQDFGSEISKTRQDFSDHYLSLREHEEFVRRFNSDLQRIETENREQNMQMATKNTVDAHAHADETVRDLTSKRLDQMQNQIDLLIRRSLAQPSTIVPTAPK